eukprot:scaffold90639_cov66-Phaeocystis_antarctica.AAC.15
MAGGWRAIAPPRRLASRSPSCPSFPNAPPLRFSAAFLAASWHAGSSLPVQARMAALVKLFLSGRGIHEGSRLSCV